MNEGSSKMLANITKVLKALNEEATIVEIGLPEHISEDTRERLEQVVTHFKAVSMKDTGNYVLCSCIHYSEDDKAMLFNDTDFIVFRDRELNPTFNSYVAIITNDIGRYVINIWLNDSIWHEEWT